MKKPMKKSLMTTALLLLSSLPALAAQQTATLSVPGMTCASCPFTVKAALKRVEGVSSVEALTQATTNAGYPSTLKPGQATQEERL